MNGDRIGRSWAVAVGVWYVCALGATPIIIDRTLERAAGRIGPGGEAAAPLAFSPIGFGVLLAAAGCLLYIWPEVQETS